VVSASGLVLVGCSSTLSQATASPEKLLCNLLAWHMA